MRGNVIEFLTRIGIGLVVVGLGRDGNRSAVLIDDADVHRHQLDATPEGRWLLVLRRGRGILRARRRGDDKENRYRDKQPSHEARS